MKKNLQEKVQKMLDGEPKRRKIALKWVEEIQNILLPISPDVWGAGEDTEYDPTHIVWVKSGILYFRYETHIGSDDDENVGFYSHVEYDLPYWGKSIEELRGGNFWWAIRTIFEWLETVIELIESKEKSREALLLRLKVD